MTKIDSREVKALMYALGAELCGIAGVDRFGDAPQGYHPNDVMPSCRSVVSFACRLPVGTLRCVSHAPYTRARNSITPHMDSIALRFCMEMEKRGVACAPVPTNESEWDERMGRWRSVVSQKHAAQAAGLGAIGRHSLLITPQLGSMVWLGMVLCEAELEPDPLLPSLCTGCNLCVSACPAHALDGPQLAQDKCWSFAFGDDEEKKTWRIGCHRCRDICPFNLGSLNRGI